MQPGSPSFGNLAEGLAALSQQRATGELILSSVDNQWHIYLFLGRLLYATGGSHRVRRWYRGVTQDCPSFKYDAPHLNKDEWEYHLLKQGINQNQLTLTKAKSVIGKIVHEVLFALVGHSDLCSRWLPRKLHPIALLDLEQSLQTAVSLWEQWQNTGLGQLCPDAAPIFKQPISEQNLGTSETFLSLIQLVNGENTIWDIALQLRQSVTTVASALQQLANQGILEFLTVPDLPAPIDDRMVTPSSQRSLKPLTTIHQITTPNELAKQLLFCSGEQFTGQLEVEDSQGKQWSLYFYLGDLMGCASSVHPVRRWCRQLFQHCPQLTVDSEANSRTSTVNQVCDLPQCWDYDSLAELLKQGKVLQKQMAALVEDLIIEILFDLHQHLEQCQHSELQLTYSSISTDPIDSTNSVLVLISADHAWQQATQAWKAWRQAGLVECSPNLAPIIWQAEELRRQTSPLVYQKLTNLADGNRTLRDLAVKLKQNALPIIQSIRPYLSQQLMGLVEVKDHSFVKPVKTTNQEPAFVPPPVSPVQPQPTGPLVAYIDDSQSDSLTMGHILTLAGYRFINVQDAVTALPTLLEYKPSLIFLDLVMPIANGYEICVQVRRVTAFKDTPVIIVTSHDGIVDRVRAKMVGSSGFLAKPITAEKVLRILQRHLPTSMPVKFERLQTVQA